MHSHRYLKQPWVRNNTQTYKLNTNTVQENKHTKTKYKSNKADNLKTAKQNYPGSVASDDTRPGNEVGLFYNDNTHGPRNPHGAHWQ